MAVMIVTSNSAGEAKSLRDGLKRSINPNVPPTPDWYDPDKAQ
jgi:hypothetical protein